MIEISFVAGECFFAALWLLARTAVWIRQRGVDWKREALLLLMYVNLAVMIRFSFFPMEKLDGRIQPLLFDPGSVLPFNINLSPFVHMGDYVSEREELLNFIGNIALFIPSGIILPVLYGKLDSLMKVMGAGALLSVCVELLQLPFSVRVSDVDDLIMNVCGIFIGYMLFRLVRSMVKRDKNGSRGGT